jgi:signal transduction histidine kinase
MAEPAAAPGPAAGHGRLLVVDDEPFLRDAVAASLTFLGYQVATADTGTEGLRLAREQPLDLVVLDVMLPDTDGFEVVRRLRREGSWVPVIFLTARDTREDKVNGLSIGADDYLTKPFGLEELAARIRTVLRTPLASLRANSELYLQGALPERAQVDEAMRRITAESQRMGGLVDDMLRLARLDQHPDRQREPVDLSVLAAECARRARTVSPDRTWRTGITAGLEVCGDEELLRRAIDNILANVTAHTPAGSAAALTADWRDGDVVVEVSDNGPGVPPGQLPRIFDRFYRAGAPSHRPGSGLGLAIVAAVAAAHDGTAAAVAAEPHGLRVSITLPGLRSQPGPTPKALR